MGKKLQILLLILAAFFVFTGAAQASESNLLANPELNTNSDGIPDAWRVEGNGSVQVEDDDEYEKVAVLALEENGNAHLVQDIAVESDKIYRISFKAKVEDYSGYDGAYVMIENEDWTISEKKAIGSEWTEIELYGRTSPEQKTLSVALSFGNAERGDKGKAYFAAMDASLVEEVPEGAQFVWFYDRDAWEAGNEEEKKNDGFTWDMLLAMGVVGGFILVLLIVRLVVNRREKKQLEEGRVRPDLPGSPRKVHTGMPSFIRVTNRKGERITGRDYLLMAVVTVVYSFIAMINLGSTEVPQTYWRTKQDNESFIIQLEETSDISHVYFYPGVGKGHMKVELSENGTDYGNDYKREVLTKEMYVWQTLETPGKAKTIRVTAENAGLFINEMAIFDTEGNMLKISSITQSDQLQGEKGNINCLFDEQELVDTRPTYMNQMYFDEIYHARTAFEHLNGMAPYENSHPPLGKVFIMLGIYLFGMNPFGWRIIGTLFGIFMLPMLYVFAKRLFKDTRYALIAMLLFAFDGMHFVQTRIATIDVYGVFFIIAMCYYMYRYWQMNFYVDGLGKTFVPLGLSGVMFGLGIASKWIAFYAGGGLAVLFFVSLGKRHMEYRLAKRALEEGTESDRDFLQYVVESYWGFTMRTILFCILFFIIIPVGIYLASYIPYFLCTEKPYDLAGVWGVQEFMFTYHSQLTATHPFQSPWYQWPVIARPIYYYSGKHLAEGNLSSIAAFGNPAVWWGGLIATIYCMVAYAKKSKKIDVTSTGFILTCLAAAFLPWALITRATFIYHYFASVPFIILLTAMMLKRFERKDGKLARWGIVLLVAAGILFFFFYPVWSGWIINRAYALKFIQWFPSWWFF